MYTTFIISKGILYDSVRKVSIFFRHRQINLHIYLKIAFLCVQNNILLIKYSLKIIINFPIYVEKKILLFLHIS